MSIKSNFYCLLITLSVFSCRSYADGLTDLNKTLSKFAGDSAIYATLQTSFTEKRGRKKKTKITTALANIQLRDDFNGLQITYSNEVLSKINAEKDERERNEEVNTPTRNAINNIEASELRNMLSAVPKLTRSLIKAEFLKEEAILYQEKDVRILHFNLPLEAIIKDKDVRSYVDDFEGKYQIIIDGGGVPLQAKLTFKGSGSAYIFFKLSIDQSRTYFYKVIGDRLVNFRNEFTRRQKSTWDKRESSGFNELTLTE